MFESQPTYIPWQLVFGGTIWKHPYADVVPCIRSDLFPHFGNQLSLQHLITISYTPRLSTWTEDGPVFLHTWHLSQSKRSEP